MLLKHWTGLKWSLQTAFHRAGESRGLVVRSYRVCGHPIRFAFAGETLVAPVLGALSHHPPCDDEEADFEICVWQGEPNPDLEFPGRRGRHFGPGGAWRVGCERLPGYFTALDRKRAFLWAADLESYPVDRYASPLRSTLLWWFAAHDLHGMHAAAVGWKGRGALLVGHGGAGKSTTSLNCLLHGMDFLGDDITLLETGSVPRVHTLFSSAKVDDDKLGEGRVREPDERRRRVHWLWPDHQRRIPLSLPVSVVLKPQITHRPQTTIHAISPMDVLAKLGPSTIRVLATATGTESQTLSACAELVRKVPCYSLNLGSDRAEVCEKLQEFFEEIQ